MHVGEGNMSKKTYVMANHDSACGPELYFELEGGVGFVNLIRMPFSESRSLFLVRLMDVSLAVSTTLIYANEGRKKLLFNSD